MVIDKLIDILHKKAREATRDPYSNSIVEDSAVSEALTQVALALEEIKGELNCDPLVED